MKKIKQNSDVSSFCYSDGWVKLIPDIMTTWDVWSGFLIKISMQ